jgi:hypothetical protein
MRAAAAEYWPFATQKNLQEKILDRVESIQPTSFVETIEDPAYRAHVLSQRSILARQAMDDLKKTEKIVSVWSEIG